MNLKEVDSYLCHLWSKSVQIKYCEKPRGSHIKLYSELGSCLTFHFVIPIQKTNSQFVQRVLASKEQPSRGFYVLHDNLTARSLSCSQFLWYPDQANTFLKCSLQMFQQLFSIISQRKQLDSIYKSHLHVLKTYKKYLRPRKQDIIHPKLRVYSLVSNLMHANSVLYSLTDTVLFHNIYYSLLKKLDMQGFSGIT